MDEGNLVLVSAAPRTLTAWDEHERLSDELGDEAGAELCCVAVTFRLKAARS